MGKRGVSKYLVYLQDEQVGRWLKNLARGSPITAEVALRRLSKLCGLFRIGNLTILGLNLAYLPLKLLKAFARVSRDLLASL